MLSASTLSQVPCAGSGWQGAGVRCPSVDPVVSGVVGNPRTNGGLIRSWEVYNLGKINGDLLQMKLVASCRCGVIETLVTAN